MKKNILFALGLLALVSCTPKQETNFGGEPIKVNQVGYYPNQEKVAVIEDSATVAEYVLLDTEGNQVWSGAATREQISPLSQKKRAIVDFSAVTTPGQYTFKAGNFQRDITIADHALYAVGQAGMKALYLQRTGVDIEEQYAGQYARPAAHADTLVLVHPSAASKNRPAGTVISSPGGWYDAGDFNKYIVNSAFTISQMLTAYELVPEAFYGYKNNIPESGNDIPDLLDEIMFNLEWMLTMQDPEDGGVYHKLTTPHFEAFIMPAECQQQRYVVMKTTAAALDFAATMAQAARVYAEFPKFEEFVKKATPAAIKAFQWAQKNKHITYRQDELNEKFEPKVTTGAYDDELLDDEFFWAATELYVTTGKRSYLNTVNHYRDNNYIIPVWGNVRGLAMQEWMVQASYGFSPEAQQYANKYQASLLAYCDSLLTAIPTSCFQSSWGNAASDFCWGCLAEHLCNQAISQLYAYQLTSEKKYLEAALQNADAMLGRNALGYCYVTGFGQKSPMHPHQRLSAADGIENPLPGFLVGGPNMGRQDIANCNTYTSDCLDESYTDDMNSYASNEIAINWNAGLITFIPWLDYALSK